MQNIIYMLQLPSAWRELEDRSLAEDTESPWQLLISDMSIPISILVPAHNEEKTIAVAVQALLSLRYPMYNLVVVNDGSTDGTLASLIEYFDLKPVYRSYELRVPHAPIRGLYASPRFPHLLIVDKENGGGKADALNAAVNLARYPLFCVVDADSLLEPDALLRSVRAFMENRGEMVAVGGTIRVLNGCTVIDGQIKKVALPRKILPLIQSMEYIRSFLMARLAWSRWGMLTIISGAFGIFSRNAVMDVDGFSHGTVGEDYDLVMKIHRDHIQNNKPYAMRYIPEPVCWTEAPETLEVLGAQRKRWQTGALEVFFRNKDMLFSKHHGKLGWLAVTNNFLMDVIGPLAEGLGYILVPLFWVAGILDTDFLLAYIAVFFTFGVFISVCSLILEEVELRRTSGPKDFLILAVISVIENFGYRQLCNLWRILGWWRFLKGKKEWGVMERSGLSRKEVME